MGVFSNLRGPKIGSTHEGLAVANASPPSSLRRKVSSFLPICVAIVVLVEIASMGRLDNASLLDTFTGFLAKSPSDKLSPTKPSGLKVGSGMERCEEWLEREDSDFESCSVDCAIGMKSNTTPDAAFGLSHQPGTLSILRSMESARYYLQNNLAQARRKGYDIVMTTSLSSDVPVGYFSWAEYDVMAPVQPKTEKALAAAFISNCIAQNFRLQALEALMEANVTIDSYGTCHRNRNERVEKVEALKHYKFSLAFENTNEEDYVTEKFFQSLVAARVPDQLQPKAFLILAQTFATREQLQHTTSSSFATASDSSRPTIKDVRDPIEATRSIPARVPFVSSSRLNSFGGPIQQSSKVKR
uniref:Fucosyltransferase n=1 Tax=Brassica oleracea var. oleracea TaxID=109376 RepID=A0A0D3CII3_BRAOL